MTDHREQDSRFRALLAEYDPPLRRLAAVYEGDPALAENLLQEIRLALWRALPAFRGDGSERAFVYRVAHNRALTHVARRRPEEAADLSEAEEVADGAPDPEQIALERMETLELRERVAALPVGLRQGTMLVLEGLSNGEISEVLGISEGNVAVRLVRAKQQLRQEGAGRNEDWEELRQEWMDSASDAAATLRAVKLRRAPARLQSGVVVLAAVSLAGFVGSLWVLLHQSAMAYTFGLLFWSAYSPLVGYWRTREPADEAALPALSAMERRIRRLERSAGWLELGRALLGVETLLCAVFWVVLARGGASGWAWIVWGILPAGGLGYAGLSAMLRRVRQERERLRTMAEEMRSDL